MRTINEHEIAAFILNYGGVDGAHHKQWVLDQVLRAILDGDDYELTIEQYEQRDEHGEPEYVWDEGIAP